MRAATLAHLPLHCSQSCPMPAVWDGGLACLSGIAPRQAGLSISKDSVERSETMGNLLHPSGLSPYNKGSMSALRLVKTMAVSCVKLQGGGDSQPVLYYRKQMSWAQKNRTYISAAFVPKVQNILTYFLSRVQLANVEWSVDLEVFGRRCPDGSLEMQRDLFVSSILGHPLVSMKTPSRGSGSNALLAN